MKKSGSCRGVELVEEYLLLGELSCRGTLFDYVCLTVVR